MWFLIAIIFVSVQNLSTYQQTHKLHRMPNLLEYLSYVFASGNLLAGPTFELSDYLDYIERKGVWSPKSRPIPSPVVPGLLRFVKALICMGLHLYLVASFSPDVLESSWFYGLSIPRRLDSPVNSHQAKLLLHPMYKPPHTVGPKKENLRSLTCLVDFKQYEVMFRKPEYVMWLIVKTIFHLLCDI